ncbi:MAG: hypothetical protein U0X92_13635 [Anaerolineales bacterium]
MSRLGKFDVHFVSWSIHYTFDLVMDQGAYAEFKRHRIDDADAAKVDDAAGSTRLRC